MKIFVVIPAFNRARLVCDALDSVAAQSRPADCVVVMDDGSSDERLDVLLSIMLSGDRWLADDRESDPENWTDSGMKSHSLQFRIRQRDYYRVGAAPLLRRRCRQYVEYASRQCRRQGYREKRLRSEDCPLAIAICAKLDHVAPPLSGDRALCFSVIFSTWPSRLRRV